MQQKERQREGTEKMGRQRGSLATEDITRDIGAPTSEKALAKLLCFEMSYNFSRSRYSKRVRAACDEALEGLMDPGEIATGVAHRSILRWGFGFLDFL